MIQPIKALHSKKGFTLIELLVVIAIIGILATVIVASFVSAQRRGRDSRRKSELDAVKKALELYKTNFQFYPSSAATVVPQFIKVMPTDPVTAASYTYTPAPAGCSAAGTPCSSYQLYASLENATDPDDTLSQNRCGVSGVGVVNDRYMVCNP